MKATVKMPLSLAPARVSFATRHSAERAFVNGKSWHGHNLHFLWATPSIPCCSRSSGESFSSRKSALYADIQSADKTAQTNSLKASGDPTDSVSSCAQPLNEVSCDSSRSGDRGTAPFAGGEHSVSEAESPDKSVIYPSKEMSQKTRILRGRKKLPVICSLMKI